MTLYLLMSTWQTFFERSSTGSCNNGVWQCVPYIDYTMPVGASNKSRIAQRFAQLLTMTTCVSACWVSKLIKHVKVHVNQIINSFTTQQKVSCYSTLLKTAEVQSDQSLGYCRLDKPANFLVNFLCTDSILRISSLLVGFFVGPNQEFRKLVMFWAEIYFDNYCTKCKLTSVMLVVFLFMISPVT